MPTTGSPLPTGAEKRKTVQTMFDRIAPRYDLVNRLMTFRLDVRWRRRSLNSLKAKPGDSVLDLACGTGDFAKALAEKGIYPVGVDLSIGMLKAARADLPLLQGDLLALPFREGAADHAVCGFALRNLVELPPFFGELSRVVRPGGRIALLEVSEPDNRIMRFGHGIYFNRIVPRIGALLSDSSAYQYLPKSVSYLPAPSVLTQLLEEADFTDLEHHQLSGGIAQLITATRSA